MNQILNLNDFSEQNSYLKTEKNKSKTFFKFQFIFCSIIAFVISIYYFYLQYEKNKNQLLSEEIVQNFSITNLYTNTQPYDASYTSVQNTYQTDSSVFSVIGLIEIKSIGVYYPIINEFNYDLLKIAPCKFLGPNPNEIRKSLYRRP